MVKKIQNNKMFENILIGVCIIIILVLIYLIYKKLTKEENFQFQKLTPKRQDNFIENYNENFIIGQPCEEKMRKNLKQFKIKLDKENNEN